MRNIITANHRNDERIWNYNEHIKRFRRFSYSKHDEKHTHLYDLG